MIDVRLLDETGTPMSTPTSSDAGSDSEQEDSDGGMTEIRFVPDDKTKLDEMFAQVNCDASVGCFVVFMNRCYISCSDVRMPAATPRPC